MKAEIVSEVHHIMEVLNERVNGYQKAIENVDDQEASSLFLELKKQAEAFEEELKPFAEINPEEAGTRVIGDVWHFWMDLKGAITRKGTEAMLGACITGEKAAVRNYEEVLADESLPSDLRSILQRQLEDINAACENLVQLKSNL
jgi:uncharacterized protein (TIGR02284 family)